MTDKELQDLREQLRAKMQQAGTLRPMPKAQRDERRERARHDKAYFLRTYCPHFFQHEFSANHIQTLANCDERNRLVLLMDYRYYGKSAIGSFGDPLYKIFQETRHFLIAISHTEDMAEPFVAAIKLEIEENPRLRQDYGNLVGSRTWTSTDIITRNDRRLWARGIFQPIRGRKHGPYRPDDVFFDDAESDQSADSLEQSQKIFRRIWKAVRPALQRQKDGGYSWRWIGTPITDTCVTWLLWKDEERDILKERIPIVDERGNPTWPEVYSQAEVESIRRDVGLQAWHTEYLLEPLPSDSALFRPEWIQYADRLPAFGVGDITIGMIDTSGTVSGDFKASVVLTLHRASMTLYVRDAYIRKASPKELWQAVADQQALYGCRHVIEDNALKDYLWESLELYERDAGVLLTLTPITHTLVKKEHVLPLQSPLERKKLYFQKGHSDQSRLIEQLLVFPNGKNDEGPDALGECYRQILRQARVGQAAQQLRASGSRAAAELNNTYTDFAGYL